MAETPIQSPYTFNVLPGGNVETMQNGQRISTGTASAAGAYGYNPLQQAKDMNAPAVVPTTLSGDKNQVISDNTQKINDINNQKQQNQVQQFTGGLEKYSDGTPINAPTDAVVQHDENGNTWWMSGGKNYAVGPDIGLSEEDKQSKDLLEKIKTQTDKAFADQIAAVQAQFNTLKQLQQDVNKRQGASVNQTLLSGGTSRYAGLNAAGIDTAQINYGIQQIADLVQKENTAVAQLNAAQAEKDYEFAGKTLTLLVNIKKDKQDAYKTLNDKLVTANKDLRTQKQTTDNVIDNDIRTAILDAKKGGATIEQLAGMQEALNNHDYAGAVAAGGDSLRSASGWMGDYINYKKEAESRGQVPMDPVAFKNWDDNNKIAIARAGAYNGVGGSNLPQGTEIPFQSTIDSALSGVSNASRGPLKSELYNLANKGDYVGLLNRVEQASKGQLTAQNRTTLEQAQIALPYLSQLTNKLKEYQASGGDMGLIKGTESNIATNLGQLATDPKFASLAAELKILFQTYRLNMTGAAFSEKESKEYASVVPTGNKNLDLNFALLDGLKNSKEAAVDNAYSSVLPSGSYMNLKSQADAQQIGGTGPTHDLIQTEDAAKQKVIDYGTTNTEAKAQIRQMVTEGVPYLKIMKAFNLQ